MRACSAGASPSSADAPNSGRRRRKEAILKSYQYKLPVRKNESYQSKLPVKNRACGGGQEPGLARLGFLGLGFLGFSKKPKFPRAPRKLGFLGFLPD